MIKAEVRRADELVLVRIYDESTLTLEAALKRIESYVVEERLNEDGPCTVRLVFCTPVPAPVSR